MIPTYQNSSTSPFQDQLLPFYTRKSQSSFSSQDHRELHHIEYEQEASNLASHGGSQDHSDRGPKLCFLKKEEDGNENRGAHGDMVKGIPLKLRFRRKMNSSDQMKCEDQKQPLSPMESGNSSNSFSTNNSPIRVCSDCNTSKTPLWRSGPRGPKSLCNACGIRQRKARRAMGAALAAANGTVLETETSRAKARVQVHKANRPRHGHVAKFKKRSKLANPTHISKKICFEEFLINLSKNLAIHQVFPQDEKEAAILLMAISSGLVHG